MSTTISGDDANFPGKVTTDELKVTGGTPGAGKVLTSDADGDATWQAVALAGFDTGSHNITNGVDGETITGLALSFVPTTAVVSVRKPSGGLNLYASVVAATITADGFAFTLNGTTDSANYILDYVIFV